MIPSLLLTVLTSFAPAGEGGELVAIRVGKAETIAHGTLEHAVILIEGDKIVMIGEDLPIERGIRVIDLEDWTAMPGLVSCHTRVGLDRSSARSFEPQLSTRNEVYPDQDVWGELLAAGITTLGLVPSGGAGVPGQAVAIRPVGDTVEEMLLSDQTYLKVHIGASASAKKAVREAFEKVTEYEEKVQKEREKWEKAREKEKKKSSRKRSRSKKDDDEEKEDEDKAEEKEDAKDEKKTGPFKPSPADEKVQVFLDLIEGRLSALMSIRKAGDYLHLLDVLESDSLDGKNQFPWVLHAPLRNDIDYFLVAEKIGERDLVVLTEPRTTLQMHSLRERNIPAELARAGAHVAFTPRSDDLDGHEKWFGEVGYLVARGLDRQAALAAVTREPAKVLGLEERLGALAEGLDANIVFWNGDPLEPSARIQAVMLEGKFVVGDVE